MQSGGGKSTLEQIFRYALVGLLSNTLGFFLYLLISHLGVAPKVAMTLVYAGAAATSFFANKSLTFKYGGCVVSAGFRFLMVHCVGYLINLVILFVFVDGLGLAHQLVQGGAIFVVAAFLFLMFRIFVFSEKFPR